MRTNRNDKRKKKRKEPTPFLLKEFESLVDAMVRDIFKETVKEIEKEFNKSGRISK